MNDRTRSPNEVSKSFSARLVVALSIVALLVSAGCSPEDSRREGRLRLTYWEKWTGFELESMRGVIDLFNESQDKIFVDLLSISQIERKITVAIAGGNPPDIAGLTGEFVPALVEQNAIYPIDGYLERAGVSADDYIDVFWKPCVYDGFTWAIPSCGGALAWHFNKALFRELGLDPTDPPKTLEELEGLEEHFNIIHPKRIERVAFLPSEPDWWPYVWPFFFGGDLYDGDSKMTLTSPETVKAYEWVGRYSERLGREKVQAFRGGFGKIFASPQNPFLSGKLASVLQGNWMHTFVEKYNPSMEFGVAPMPTSEPEFYGATFTESDILFIPNGAEHPDESFEVIRFITSQQGAETFTSQMRSVNPRRVRSPEFVRDHPNPNIELFDQLVMGGKGKNTPPIAMWYEVLDEMKTVFDKVWLGQSTAAEALQAAEVRLQARLDQDRERWERVGPARREKWKKFVEATREGKDPL